MNSFAKKLGKYLKDKRTDAELSQAEVAKKLGYNSAQYISNFERGLCMPPLKKLRKLVLMYNIEPEVVYDMMLKAQEIELSKIILNKKIS